MGVKPSRRLHRSGRFRVAFQQISGGPAITAALSALDPAEKTQLRVDSEGAVTGGPQSKAKMLVQLGVSYVTGKIVDDLMEEGIKAALGAAVAGSAATAARYTSLAIGTAAVRSATRSRCGLAGLHRNRDNAEPAG